MVNDDAQLGPMFTTADVLRALRLRLVSLACCTQSQSVDNILTLTRLTRLRLSTELGHTAHAVWKLPSLKQLELVRCGGSLNALLVNGAMHVSAGGLLAVGCQFRAEPLTSLTHFTLLRRLALRNCGLQQLPALAALQQLRLLDLSDNESLKGLEPALALTAPMCLVFEGTIPRDRSFVQAVERLPAVSQIWIQRKTLSCVEWYNISCLCRIISSRGGKLCAVHEYSTE